MGNVNYPWGVFSSKWASDTSYTSDYAFRYYNPFGSILWLRIADNGTSRICSWSGDGFTWQAIDTQTRTDYLTANEVGFYVEAWNSTTPNFDVAMHLIHWDQA
jgi:hypothetical protein